MVDIARVRRESLRWSLLVALNKTRPYTASETLLLDVARAIYPTPPRLSWCRELDHLSDRKNGRSGKALRRLVLALTRPASALISWNMYRNAGSRHRPSEKYWSE